MGIWEIYGSTTQFYNASLRTQFEGFSEAPEDFEAIEAAQGSAIQTWSLCRWMLISTGVGTENRVNSMGKWPMEMLGFSIGSNEPKVERDAAGTRLLISCQWLCFLGKSTQVLEVGDLLENVGECGRSGSGI